MKSKGYSLLEVLMAMTVMVIVGGAAIPLAQSSVDRTRAAAAAHYVAGRVAMARFEAVRRSAYVAIQFVQQPGGYRMQNYVDGNRNSDRNRYTDCYGYSYSYRHRHRHSYSYINSNINSYRYSQTHANAKVSANAEAAPHATPSAVMGTEKWLVTSE